MSRQGGSSSGRSTGQRRVQTQIPPGATGPANSSATRHPLPSLAAVMSAPERQNMHVLHPEKENDGLWFDIDDCIHKDIVASYQSNFWGSWWNYSMVPQDKKDEWWTCFVQKYYWDPKHKSLVYKIWEKGLMLSISDLVSKRKKSGKKPDFIGLSDWNIMLDSWEEPTNQKRSNINSENATSDPDGLSTHHHTSGAKPHIRVAHEITVEAGGVKPPLTAVVLKTHINKNGTVIDKRAKNMVKADEALALERSSSGVSDRSGYELSTHVLDSAYIENAKNKRGPCLWCWLYTIPTTYLW